jgi:chemotaxis protein MotB
MNNRRRRRGDGDGAAHADERWLLTYADMITLLMALFIVMWAISSVNISKFEELKHSLARAFSGDVPEGGAGILVGAEQIMEPQGAEVETPTPAPNEPQQFQDVAKALEAQREELESLRALQHRIDEYAEANGLTEKIETRIDERGLVVRLLTDEVLFDSGDAVLKADSLPLLGRIEGLLVDGSIKNPIRVEGHTDDIPISTARFRNNWELSASRATAVGTYLLERGFPPKRLSVAGYADTRPVASNSFTSGRAINRRVELVVLRTKVATLGGVQ